MSANKTVASFGGGVNSTAMLIGLHERGESVDLILFADTGGEKPETYEHCADFSRWLVAHGMPGIVTVREERWTLEQDCLNHLTLPSIVTGIRSCSDKFKIRPQENWLKAHGIAEHCKLIGFDAGEPWRAARSAATGQRRYPLIEWGWAREECVEAIERAGLEVPPKSSCFFCPEMQEHEILDLADKHPELAARAVEMEREARKGKLVTIKGLARDYSWEQVLAFHREQGRLPGINLLPPRPERMPCMCYDGEPEARLYP